MGSLFLFTADSLPLANNIPAYDNYTDLKELLLSIKSINDYKILLSSWTPQLSDKEDILKLIIDSKNYLNKLDIVVQEYYSQNELNPLENCRKVIKSLNLPSAFVIPLVDIAFKTHKNLT